MERFTQPQKQHDIKLKQQQKQHDLGLKQQQMEIIERSTQQQKKLMKHILTVENGSIPQQEDNKNKQIEM